MNVDFDGSKMEGFIYNSFALSFERILLKCLHVSVQCVGFNLILNEVRSVIFLAPRGSVMISKTYLLINYD